jgi:hypothetical protein
MLVSAAAIYGLTASSAFGFANLRLTGLDYTDESAVRDRLPIAAGENLFGLRTEDLEAALRQLPTVVDAAVEVRLPDTVAVTLTEREAILVWRVGERRFLVDREGTLFTEVADPPPPGVRGLRAMDDRRAASAGLAVGGRVDAVDLDAATRLGSLRPSDVGSVAGSFRVIINDEHGFVLAADPRHWTAIFGFYSPTQRRPDMIPGQVDLLRSILARAPERNVERVILASATDGTFTTPAPSATPRP